jgi:CHASE2 domain-containing sensor protein
MAERERDWFPAKRYGWGWGPPSTWQGWVVLGAAVVLEVGIAWATLPRAPLAFAGATGLCALALLVVCYRKGEPPAWRWGDRDA